MDSTPPKPSIIVIDYLNQREPHHEAARLLMIAGYAGEFDLRISSSQITDLIYVLSNGGRKSEVPGVLEQLKGLRTFIGVFAVSDREIDLTLTAGEKDPEDHLLLEVAMPSDAMRSSPEMALISNQA